MRVRKLLALLVAILFIAAACADTPDGDVAFTGDPIPQDAPTDAEGDSEDGAATDEAGSDANAGDAPADGDTDDAAGTDEAQFAAGPVDITLSAANTIGGGDGDATGSGTVDISTGQFCVDIAIEGLGSAATAAHVHLGDSTETGGVLVPLPTPEAGDAEGTATLVGCVEVDDGTRGELIEAPGDLYLNVHTEDFPDGALRGPTRVGGRPMAEPDNWKWRDGPVDAGSAVIFDMDGVLSDAAGRQHFLEYPRRDWQAFFEACGDDPLIEEVSTLLHLLEADQHVILLTARPIRVQRQTLGWLERYGLPWDLLIMRDYGDYASSAEFKRETVNQLRAYEFDIRLAFEDDRRNVTMFHKAGIPCVYIHSGYYD